MPTLCCILLCEIVARADSHFTPPSNTSRYTEKKWAADTMKLFYVSCRSDDNKAAASDLCCWWVESSYLFNATQLLGNNEKKKKILEESLWENFLNLDDHESSLMPQKLQRWPLTCFVNTEPLNLFCTVAYYLFMNTVLSRCYWWERMLIFYSLFLGWMINPPNQNILSKSCSKLGFFQ